jgi:hypothetical protein
MAGSLSISGIGYPMAGLGNYGLGSVGAYGSYDNYMPSMMGMNSSLFGTGSYGGYGTYGNMSGMMNPMMMGMYYPTFMQQQQNQVEELQLQQAANMHEGLKNNEVKAYKENDSTLIRKMLTNSDVMLGIQNLYDKVKEGDQDAICSQFDNVKSYIANTYKDEFGEDASKRNPSVSAARLIEQLYSSVVSAQTGEVHDLRSDIVQNGDGAIMNGFWSGFRRDHHQRYVDQTLNHCFGLEIDHKASKDGRKEVAEYAGRGASIAASAAAGAAVGAGAYVLGGGTLSVVKKAFGGKLMDFKWGHLTKGALIAAGLAAVGDAVWQYCDAKQSV